MDEIDVREVIRRQADREWFREFWGGVAARRAEERPDRPLRLELARWASGALADRWYLKDSPCDPLQDRETPADRIARWRYVHSEMPDAFDSLEEFARSYVRIDLARRAALSYGFSPWTDWRRDQLLLAERARREARRIGARLRREVLASGPCVYCGDPPTVVDHVLPVAHGGTRRRRNLAPCCTACNVEKKDRLVSEWITQRLTDGLCWPPASRATAR